MQVLQHLIDTLNSVPGSTWEMVAETVGSAFVVSPLALAIKRWFSVDSEKKMTLLVILGSILAAAGAYVINDPTLAPYVILVQGWLVYATSQPVYYFFVKPLSKRFSTWFATEVSKKVEIKISQELFQNPTRPAAIPAQPLIDDFSH